jgi:hypothetical protein
MNKERGADQRETESCAAHQPDIFNMHTYFTVLIKLLNNYFIQISYLLLQLTSLFFWVILK